MKLVLPRTRESLHRWLRWSERYFKTDMVYLTTGGFWLVLERASGIGAGFLMAVIFANLLEPEKYGVYKYVLSVSGIIGALSLAGMFLAVSQAVSRGYEGSLRAGFKASLQWGIVTFAAALVVATYYFLRGNTVLGVSFLIAGTLVPFINASALYDNFLAGSKRFSVKAFYGSGRNMIPPIALVLTLMFTQSPLVLIAVYFISTACVTYAAYAGVSHRYISNNKVDDATLNYSKHLSVINILGVLAAQADRVLVFTFLGGTALAIYSIAEAVPDQIRSLNSISNVLVLPKLTQRTVPELKKLLPRRAVMVFLIALAMAGVYIAFAPLFFSTFFPYYLNAVAYSQVYALTLLAIPATLFSNTLIAHAKKKQLYTQRIVSASTEIVLLIILIPLYGIWGAIIATLISYVIANLLLLWQFSRL